MKDGFTTSEFWQGFGALAGIYTLASEYMPVMADNSESSLGMGIGLGLACVGLAYLAAKYADTRTQAKKGEKE